MLLDPTPQATNSTREYYLTLEDPDGGSPLGLFDGTEFFGVKLWPGDDHAALWESVGRDGIRRRRPLLGMRFPR